MSNVGNVPDDVRSIPERVYTYILSCDGWRGTAHDVSVALGLPHNPVCAGMVSLWRRGVLRRVGRAYQRHDESQSAVKPEFVYEFVDSGGALTFHRTRLGASVSESAGERRRRRGSAIMHLPIIGRDERTQWSRELDARSVACERGDAEMLLAWAVRCESGESVWCEVLAEARRRMRNGAD